MMGERDPQAPLWSYRVNLEKRVRCDHPLRRINEVLDLGFVGEQVAHTYGRRGNKSVPPEVILRMMLLLFLDDIKSERELMRIIPERLDYMWFLGPTSWQALCPMKASVGERFPPRGEAGHRPDFPGFTILSYPDPRARWKRDLPLPAVLPPFTQGFLLR